MNMTFFEQWMLKRICKRIVKQSHDHESNVTEYYRIIKEALEKEFTEDSELGLHTFLKECHNNSLNKS